MKRAALHSLVLIALLGVTVVGVASRSGTSRPQHSGLVNMVLAAAEGKAPPRLPNGLFVPQPSAGLTEAVLAQNAKAGGTAPVIGNGLAPEVGTTGCPHVFAGPVPNVRANQDCGFRFQSEEWISVNPTDPANVVVSQNDSKLSGNHTGVDFSVDGGAHFGDSVLPAGRITIPEAPGGVWSFDFFSDPASTFDSQGNLYYTTLGADFAQDAFGGLFVWKSNSCLKGSALHTPGQGSCDPFSPPLGASAAVIRTNFSNPDLSDDKQLMAADTSPTSPYRDNVYVTWTIFDFSCGGNYCESPIFFSKSTDGGVSWTPAKEISGSDANLCHYGDIFGGGPADSCNFDQGSYPVVGPDGTIYVAYNNVNTEVGAAQGSGGIGQQLLVRSADGGDTWSSPVRIGLDYQTQPFSIPGHKLPSGCPVFRQCLPPNGYRMSDFPSLGIDDTTGKLGAFWSDFRNGGPCATASFGGATFPVLPCANINNDVFAAVSNDGGNTWSATKDVTPSGTAAQWQNWGDVGENGTLYVGYYDRQARPCERTGCNDITLASSTDNGTTWSYRRITTASMPNLTCGDNPAECGFLGDYLSVQYAAGNVYIVWGDTRGRDLGFPEEDVYFAKVGG